jgi:hypothetical protein
MNPVDVTRRVLVFPLPCPDISFLVTHKREREFLIFLSMKVDFLKSQSSIIGHVDRISHIKKVLKTKQQNLKKRQLSQPQAIERVQGILKIRARLSFQIIVSFVRKQSINPSPRPERKHRAVSNSEQITK